MANLTNKAQQAFQAAEEIALQFNHQHIDLPHLLTALVVQHEGVVSAIFNKMNIDMDTIPLRT